MDLSHIPVIDQHAHNVLSPEAAAQTSFRAAFTEGHDPVILDQHAQHTLFFRRSLRDLGELLECDPTEEAILARREALGLEALTQRCLTAAKLDGLLLDDGFLPEQILPLEWHSQYVRVHRLLRIEALAEGLLVQANTFENFLEQYRAALDPPPSNVVGLKSIVAYRGGLAIQPARRDSAAGAWERWKEDQSAGPPRLTHRRLLDFLLDEALQMAARHRLPMQFHTGFGDADLHLGMANPIHLRHILEDDRFREVPIVLLHASYPYTQEAGYLASVYPQVYLDLGLAVPFLSVSGMRKTARTLLELAPFSKVLYSSDAHMIPELYYLGAKWGREVLGTCLEEAITDGDLSGNEAEEVAHAILHRNASRLYSTEDR